MMIKFYGRFRRRIFTSKGICRRRRKSRYLNSSEENKHIEMQKESDIYGLREEIQVKGTPEGYSDLYKSE
ncbi:unnamed protein product [Rhizophagus irregularis]|nr:unnamed protein product [Rhizophagus irregularis]CAB5386206.1 unnamed protein product [Rhizophagus irregularis]